MTVWRPHSRSATGQVPAYSVSTPDIKCSIGKDSSSSSDKRSSPSGDSRMMARYRLKRKRWMRAARDIPDARDAWARRESLQPSKPSMAARTVAAVLLVVCSLSTAFFT